MKKVFSLVFAVLMLFCAVVSVSADISPTASTPKDHIVIDAIAVPSEAGSTTPDINNPGKVEVESGDVITLTATPTKGYKFSHWEFIFGDFEIIEGSLTTPTIVIKPTGSSDIRAEANFVKEGEIVTDPSSGPVHTLPDEPTSPVTGEKATTGTNNAIYIAMGAIVVMAAAAVVVLKKKANA